jgi:hypothetical protein
MVPKAGIDTYSGENRPIAEKQLPVAEKKSWTESDAASRTKFELVCAFKQAYKFKTRLRVLRKH